MSIRVATAFGDLMRYWRGVRSLSQLQLAVEADVSSRHVSFLETGRSKPSREMVMLVAEVLALPLRERNTMLQAAGFAPVYQENDLSSAELAPVRQSLEFLLERHNPYPAIVVDRHWNLRLQNQAAGQILSKFVKLPAALPQPANVMRILFHPDGMRPFIVNWNELAGSMIQRLHREAAMDPGDKRTHALLAEALASEGIPNGSRMPDPTSANPIASELRLRRDDLELGLFSAITTLGTPFDVTLQELRMETFFPIDDASDKVVRSLAVG